MEQLMCSSKAINALGRRAKGDHAAHRTRKKGDWKGLNRKKQKRTKQRESQVICDEQA
jgi:hypothetical protein